MKTSTNIHWHESGVTKEDREYQKNHKSAVLWFTGLYGSGKCTLSVALERELYNLGIHTCRLDGDNVSHALYKNLGFSPEDRSDNIQRIDASSDLIVEAG